MKTIVKNFTEGSDSKLIGFIITDDKDRSLAIDKTLPLVDNKTDEQYINEARVLCKDQIDEWQSDFLYVGREFDADTGKFL
jgi:hypothetical protein